MCWCQNGKCLERRNSYFALLASLSSGGLLPQNCSTKSIQWSLSSIPVTRGLPNRRYRIIFTSCIVIVISPHGRCGSLASTCWLLIQYKKFFNSNNETNQCFVLSQMCMKSYLSTAAVRSAGSRIGSPVLKTRTISRKPARCMYSRYRSPWRCGWCMHSLRDTKSSWSSNRCLARWSLS